MCAPDIVEDHLGGIYFECGRLEEDRLFKCMGQLVYKFIQ
jgi:hypothetical protein